LGPSGWRPVIAPASVVSEQRQLARLEAGLVVRGEQLFRQIPLKIEVPPNLLGVNSTSGAIP
jgi:hypothetical protein